MSRIGIVVPDETHETISTTIRSDHQGVSDSSDCDDLCYSNTKTNVVKSQIHEQSSS